MSETSRRTQQLAAPSSASTIPPAPPLPPTARSAFARFVTQPFTAYGSRPAQGQTNRADVGRPSALNPPKLPGINPLSSQSASFKIRGGAEISSIDINRDRTHAIIGGRDVLRTVRVDGTEFSEDINIRATIIELDRLNATRHRDTLDIHDVKWSHGEYSSYIATAAANGKIVVYDLDRPGIEVARLHEHSRQVHKVAFNPFQGYLLLSGSQDGTVKLWDLRDVRSNVMICRSRKKYSGQSDGIRDLKWSPKDAVEFAFGTDTGVVQKWDYRVNKAAKVRINAHDKYCTSVDWHPDGRHLLSGGQDKSVRVWDLNSDSRRQKPQWNIRTPYAVLNARWRPPFWSNENQTAGIWQCSQIATSYERHYATVHLWDLSRPYLPYREMCAWTSAPSDMLWHSERLLWTASREGQLHQTDVQYAPRVIDRRPMQAFAISPTGEICVFSQKRPRHKSFGAEYSHDGFYLDGGSVDALPEKSDAARSSFEEPIDESFLSSSYRRPHGRTGSTKHSKSPANTPPSFTESEMHNVAQLSETLSKKKDIAPVVQVSYRGFLEGTVNALTFSYLAQKYKTALIAESPSVSSYLTARKVFDQNAQYAQKTGAYRLAQTWRIFGSVIAEELLERANANRSTRLLRSARDAQDEIMQKAAGRGTGQSPIVLNPAIRAIQGSGAVTPQGMDGSSNVATPLARPHNTANTQHRSAQFAALPDPDHDEPISLPPSIITPEAGISHTAPVPIHGAKPQRLAGHSGLQDSHWYPSTTDINQRKAQMTNWRAVPKVPLDFDVPNRRQDSMLITPSIGRHNSDESFGMFSASSDSRGEFSIPASVGSVRSQRYNMGKIDESAAHDIEDGHSAGAHLSAGTAGEKSSSSQSDSSRGTLAWLAGSSSLEFSDPAHHTFHNGPLVEDRMEGSGTIIPEDNGRTAKNPRHDGQPLVKTGISATGTFDLAVFENQLQNEPFVLSDFANSSDERKSPLSPLTAEALLREVIFYHTDRLPNAQHVFHLFLLLQPILSTSIDQPETRPLLTHLDDDENGMNGYFPKVPGLNPNQMEAIIAAYQEQLQELQISNPLAVLARLAYPEHSHLFEEFVNNTRVGFVCLGCNKPINNPTCKMRCENCGKRQSPCPICWQKYPAIQMARKSRKPGRKAPVGQNAHGGEGGTVSQAGGPTWDEPRIHETESSTSATAAMSNHPVLWQSCLVCGHGAHAVCLQQIHNDPKLGGKCPTDGCLCDCVPGTYRDQLRKEAEEERIWRDAGSVRVDGKKVGESRAVKGARGMLDGDERRVRLVEPER